MQLVMVRRRLCSITDVAHLGWARLLINRTDTLNQNLLDLPSVIEVYLNHEHPRHAETSAGERADLDATVPLVLRAGLPF